MKLADFCTLGRSGLVVSPLALGTMTFGTPRWGSTDDVSESIFQAYVEAGGNFIDTADVYAKGRSEELVGSYVASRGLRDQLVLATKFGFNTQPGNPHAGGNGRKHIHQALEGSLRRLGTDYIDLYQTHSFDPLTPWEETLRALDDLVRSGKVRYIGASNVTAWQLMKALGVSHYQHLEKYVSLQAYYTIAGRDLERELVPLLLDQKVGLMVWSPLAGGFLSGKYTRENQQAEGRRGGSGFDFPPVNKELAFDIIDKLRPMAEAKGSTVAALALAWLLHQKVVSTVIIGAKKMEQLDDNLTAIDVKFTPEELQQLDEVSKLTPEYPGWMVEFTSGDRQVE